MTIEPDLIARKPLAIITGVGPGSGAAMARRFSAGGYQVAMIARNAGRLDAIAHELPDSFAVVCDVSDSPAFLGALDGIAARAGAPEVVIHNAVGGAFGSFLDISPDIVQRNFQVNVMALLHLARWAAPKMMGKGGALICTGNTSALRGKANFAGFAPTKAAQRILAESIARELGPKGIHVAYLMIDAVIDVPWTRERFKDKPDDFFIQPAAIADEAWHLVHQPRSAWSFLTELRPYGENW
ncbi:SDR family NAD(P)-dependent oxidoreductase [Bradyrhizobium sp. Tv2a-2]|uniref:SDR family NAD(P)-dependent oxidoreductase n=1 Tax=Bradyrhizobium sp. Tv2a-2 TaxID=113395 RepID=UPI00041CFB5F|nr:SDR family NAD(P)-dependent oxidoreductase [Bradyrhizobium sp. Tv2a-2]